MAMVVALAFLFGFGNVWTLALRLGVPAYVAPLVAPAVDLSVLGLLVGIRILVITDADPEALRPARMLLLFSSTVTLALNVAEPIIAQQYGRAAFDAVGPMLLIGWAEVGPTLMQAMQDIHPEDQKHARSPTAGPGNGTKDPVDHRDVRSWKDAGEDTPGNEPDITDLLLALGERRDFDPLLPRALDEDFQYWIEHRRPIPSEKLGKILGIGSTRSRKLVTDIRAARQEIIKGAITISTKEIEPPSE
ncbi:hypothetical protein MXD61_16035 [Frankia sp. AgPm24]|nr:hypothetical protein [Frankia sp. AgPm24]